MKQWTKEELDRLVQESTVETYEELAPQLMQLIQKTEENTALAKGQREAELLLSMMAYTKSCTAQILVSVLSEILECDSSKK